MESSNSSSDSGPHRGGTLRCPSCNQAYRRHQLFRHIRTVHGKVSLSPSAVARIGGVRSKCGTLLSSKRGLRRHRLQCQDCSQSSTDTTSTDSEASIPPGFARRTGPTIDTAPATGPFNSNNEAQLFEDYLALAHIPEPPSALTGARASVFARNAARLANNFVASPTALNLAVLLALPKLGIADHLTKGSVAKTRKRLDAFPSADLISSGMQVASQQQESRAEPTLSDRVNAQVRQGRLNRAARILEDGLGSAPLDDDALSRLKALHPFEPEPAIHGTGPTPVKVAKRRVQKAIRKLNRDSSGAISGWDASLLKLAAKEPDFVEFLCALTTMIASGTAPGQMLLLASRGVALKKDNHGAVRPIAVGEVFYRIAATAIGYACRTKGDLLPCQFGVGTPGGVEPLIHSYDTALCQQPEQDRTMIAIDLKNAFNSVSRRTMSAAVRQHCPSLVRFFKWAYGKHTAIVLHDRHAHSTHQITSAAGVRQGDPLGPYLFSLAYRTQLERIRNHLAEADVEIVETTVLAYLDDTILLVPTSQADAAYAAVLDAFDGQALADGFIIRPDKTVRTSSAQVAEEGVKLLGTCIGAETARAAFFRSKLSKLESMLEKLPSLRKQDAQLLLRFCLLPRMQHLQRTMDPSGIHDCWAAHDAAFARTLSTLCGGLDHLPRTKRLAELPARYGGLGFPRALTTLSAARHASLSLARWFLTLIWGPRAAETAVEEALEGERPPRQHILMRPVWGRKSDEFHENHSDQERVLAQANASPIASAWMFTCPIESGLFLSDATTVAGLRLRLQAKGSQRGFCPNCGSTQNSQAHDLACPANARRRTKRHQTVKTVLAQLYRSIGRPHITRVELEPSSTNNPQSRVDLLVSGSAAPAPPVSCIDVSIVNLSSAKSRQAIAAAGKGNPEKWLAAALAARVKAKVTRYKDDAFEGTMIPFVFSSEGAAHTTVSESFKKIRDLKLGAQLRRFLLKLSCSLLRERAATFFSTV